MNRGATAPLALSRVWRLLLLAAFVVQCNLVQAHVHFAQLAAPAVSAAARDRGQELSVAATSGASDYCLLCWEAAMAGHYLPPDAVTALPLAAIALWLAPSALPEFRLGPDPHGWLSRAPPQ